MTHLAHSASKAAPARTVSALDDISERLSVELVIAMVGPVGSGVSTAALILREILASRFGYAVDDVIKVSALISRDAYREGLPGVDGQPGYERIKNLQTMGNELRHSHGAHYLAKRAIEMISQARTSSQGFERIADDAPPRAARVRRACIIDSLKNDAELSLLRSIYKDMLVVVGVFAPDHVRTRWLESLGVTAAEVGAILDRDQGEVFAHGQQTRAIFGDADLFIRNDGDNDAGLRHAVGRFLDIVFDVGVHTPTRTEGAMHEADAVSRRSACLSRQVGAAIVDAKGDLISAGWNDVPRAGGGLYVEDDQRSIDPTTKLAGDHDHRCFRFGQRICHNDREKDGIRTELQSRLRQAGVIREGVDEEALAAAIRGSRLDAVIEFSRSIHAEIEAILAVTRDSRHSLLGATLYSITYTCHNCARHIVAAGIREVVYIQPYRKSLAMKLHHDAISEVPRGASHVLFSQYDGVAPKHFARLFKSRADRKTSAGAVTTRDPTSAEPVFQQPLDSFVIYELRVTAELEELVNRSSDMIA